MKLLSACEIDDELLALFEPPVMLPVFDEVPALCPVVVLPVLPELDPEPVAVVPVGPVRLPLVPPAPSVIPLLDEVADDPEPVVPPDVCATAENANPSEISAAASAVLLLMRCDMRTSYTYAKRGAVHMGTGEKDVGGPRARTRATTTLHTSGSKFHARADASVSFAKAAHAAAGAPFRRVRRRDLTRWSVLPEDV
jgi:hypothetical protein